MKCGLLGKKLSHSYSPQIHSYLGDYPYILEEVSPDGLQEFFANNDYTGLNVTIPYKKDVIPFCDELSDCARKMGAVNTIVQRNDGKRIGHNTDFFGFSSMVSRMQIPLTGKKALVLGSGGASVTAVAVLKDFGAKVTVISRSGENNYDNLHLHTDASIIVNATPVGMYPNAGVSPVDLDLFPHLEGVLDLIYNPAKTRLLLDAEARNIPYQNGLWMLVAQAKESAEWFTDSKISDDVICVIHEKLQKQMENIVLIGMPGCGKSTVGRMLAEKLGRDFVDADEEIVQRARMSIPEIFTAQGETGFRRLETEVLSILGQKSGQVIATGGGCVTREENYPLLHQNGIIYWLKRDLAKLPTDGRPLSQTVALEQMYAVRQPMYNRFCDCVVSNDDSPEEAVLEILKGY